MSIGMSLGGGVSGESVVGRGRVGEEGEGWISSFIPSPINRMVLAFMLRSLSAKLAP